MTANDEHVQMVADCMKRDSKMSEWEIHFIDSVSMQLDKGRALTEKQADRLELIWNKVT